MYFSGKEKRYLGNWWTTCGMQDSREKGAGMRDQDPPPPFQTLFPFFFSPGSFYFSFPILLLVCLVWFSRLSGRKKFRFGFFSLKYLAAYAAKLIFKNSAQYTAQWFQLAAKWKNEIHTWTLPSIQFIFLNLYESQEEKPKESFHLTVEMTEVRLSGVDSLFASKW